MQYENSCFYEKNDSFRGAIFASIESSSTCFSLFDSLIDMNMLKIALLQMRICVVSQYFSIPLEMFYL